MTTGKRDRIIARIYAALKKPNGPNSADVTLNLTLLAEADPEVWRDVLLAHLTGRTTSTAKIAETIANDPFDRGGK